MTELGKKIIELKEKGYSYNKIMKELNCSKSVISYYLGRGQKEKTIERNKKFLDKPEFILQKKIYRFRYKDIGHKIRDFQRRQGSNLTNKQEFNFSIYDFLQKLGDEPKCYLSGEKIDLNEAKSYSIDHITPASKGGDNSIENAGLLSLSVNKMKSDLTIEEFLQKCIQILEYNGYTVQKK